MATSIRGLKKEVKAAFERLIGDVLLVQLASGEAGKEGNALINRMVDTYEEILKKINAHRQTRDKKAYFKELNREIEAKLKEFREKVDAL